jgi:hypothetical protein
MPYWLRTCILALGRCQRLLNGSPYGYLHMKQQTRYAFCMVNHTHIYTTGMVSGKCPAMPVGSLPLAKQWHGSLGEILTFELARSRLHICLLNVIITFHWFALCLFGFVSVLLGFSHPRLRIHSTHFRVQVLHLFLNIFNSQGTWLWTVEDEDNNVSTKHLQWAALTPISL